MRIVGGKLRGRRIIAPSKLPSRPTTDMAKEALFNILQNYFDLEEIKALDLFTGTGNITYELLSRGCTSIVATDLNAFCVRFVKETIADFGERDQVEVHRYDALKYLSKLAPNSFDFIFADPPYDKGFEQKVLDLVVERDLLCKNGILVIEHSERNRYDHPWLVDSRKYGSVNFSIFERPENQ